MQQVCHSTELREFNRNNVNNDDVKYNVKYVSNASLFMIFILIFEIVVTAVFYILNALFCILREAFQFF